MKAFLIIAAIVCVLFFLGWLTFATGEGSASVTVDTNKVKEDASTAVEKGKELLGEGVDKLKEAGKKTNDAVDAEPELSPQEER